MDSIFVQCVSKDLNMFSLFSGYLKGTLVIVCIFYLSMTVYGLI